jgi:hypothetical protein
VAEGNRLLALSVLVAKTKQLAFGTVSYLLFNGMEAPHKTLNKKLG